MQRPQSSCIKMVALLMFRSMCGVKASELTFEERFGADGGKAERTGASQ